MQEEGLGTQKHLFSRELDGVPKGLGKWAGPVWLRSLAASKTESPWKSPPGGKMGYWAIVRVKPTTGTSDDLQPITAPDPRRAQMDLPPPSASVFLQGFCQRGMGGRGISNRQLRGGMWAGGPGGQDAHLFVHFQELVRGSVKPAADSLVLLTWLGSGDSGSFARQN